MSGTGRSQLVFVHGIGDVRDAQGELRTWLAELAVGARRAGHSDQVSALTQGWLAQTRFADYSDWEVLLRRRPADRRPGAGEGPDVRRPVAAPGRRLRHQVRPPGRLRTSQDAERVTRSSLQTTLGNGSARNCHLVFWPASHAVPDATPLSVCRVETAAGGPIATCRIIDPEFFRSARSAQDGAPGIEDCGSSWCAPEAGKPLPTRAERIPRPGNRAEGR